MTQQQLQDLITDHLGPIADAAARCVPVDHPTYPGEPQKRNPLAELAYRLEQARVTGALPRPPGPTRIQADQDWDAIVTG
jgi:hypothetical protein